MNQQENNSGVVTRRTVIIFAACICIILAISQIEPIANAFSSIMDVLFPVFIGVVLAYIISPLESFFERRFARQFSSRSVRTCRRLSRGLGITLALLVLVAAIVLLLFLIIPEFLQSLSRLIDMLPSLTEKAGSWIGSVFDSESPLMHNLGEYIDSLGQSIVSWISGEFSSAVSGLLEGVISVFNFVLDFFIAIVVCVYALIEKRKFIAQFKKLIYAIFSPAHANDILDVARYGNHIFGKFITGKLITSSIVGIVTFAFMSLAGIPYALLSAGVIAVTNVIPFFGPFIGGIPTALIILLTDFRQGIIYIVFLFILQQIEGNIIEPLVMEDKTGVSKFWITVALLVCGGMFGVVGMIFSVPIFAVLFYVIKIAVERSLIKKELPLSPEEYLGVGSIDPETKELRPIPETAPKKKLRDVIREWRERKIHKD